MNTMTSKKLEPLQITLEAGKIDDKTFFQNIQGAFSEARLVEVTCKEYPPLNWILEADELAAQLYASQKQVYDEMTEGKDDVRGIKFPFETDGMGPRWPIQYSFDNGTRIEVVKGQLKFDGEIPYSKN